MVQAIVYESNTGFTAQYAEMLKKAVSLPAYSVKEAETALENGAEIVFLGWLMAGSIQGLDKARKRYEIRALGAVGMAPADENQIKGLNERYAAYAPVCYLPGGFDMNKLGFTHRVMMKTLKWFIGKRIQKAETPSAQETEMLEMVNNGGTRVDEANLKPLIASIKQ